MSILIKGMEMPMNCIVCPMQFGGMCYVQPPEIDEPRVAPTVDQCVSRASWCPLIEIPDGHGRLIDADALKKDLERQCKEVFKIDAVSPDDFWITRDQAYNQRLWITWCESFYEYIDSRQTVIPSDKDGET